jgi:hypothetical protein
LYYSLNTSRDPSTRILKVAMSRPIILLHGYSDQGPSFKTWKNILIQNGFDAETIKICDYKSLTNEVTIKDIAEGFDRSLRLHGLEDKEFDAIVHSTGMLVLRAWLSTYPKVRIGRLKHLIGLAPASFGSPLAYMGRSWIGAVFKGNREKGPDFMEAGDKVLDGLELGSSFTWKLAHNDLLDESRIFYGPDPATPYVFTFIGNTSYGLIKDIVTKAPGTDGTVRWAGCSLNTRKISIDFTESPEGKISRYAVTDWKEDTRSNLGLPFLPIEGLNHATILEEPSDALIKLVVTALKVEGREALNQWNQEAVAITKDTYHSMEKYQQFVVHCKDERGDPIPDFHIQLYRTDLNDAEELIDMDMHPFSGDNSYRCYHVNLDTIGLENLKNLRLELTASSGSELISYCDYLETGTQPKPFVALDMTAAIRDSEIRFFYPFTTTLIELKLNREPQPMWQENKLVHFLKE